MRYSLSMYLIRGWNDTRTVLGQFLSPRSRGHGRRTIGDARAGSGGADAVPRCIGRCTVLLCDLLGRVLSWNDEDLVEFSWNFIDFQQILWHLTPPNDMFVEVAPSNYTWFHRQKPGEPNHRRSFQKFTITREDLGDFIHVT